VRAVDWIKYIFFVLPGLTILLSGLILDRRHR
jgi:hypothetical protein